MMKNVKWITGVDESGQEFADFKEVRVVTHVCIDGRLTEASEGPMGQMPPATWLCWQLYAWAGACSVTAETASIITGAVTGAVTALTISGRMHMYALFSSGTQDRNNVLLAVALIEQHRTHSAVIRAICVNPLKQRQGYGRIAVNLFLESTTLRNLYLIATTKQAQRFWARLGWYIVDKRQENDEVLEALFALAKKNKNARVYSLV